MVWPVASFVSDVTYYGRIAERLKFGIAKRKANNSKDDMSPDKLADAVFELIQEAIGNNQIEPDHDIAA